MCLLFIGVDAHPRYPLILAGNRDEFYDRPTAGAGFWDDAPQVLAGRDLLGGGTWLGITRQGRWAAVTNYREPDPPTSVQSRGFLVRDFLLGTSPARQYAEDILNDGARYAGFNLLVGDGHEAFHCSNRDSALNRLEAGVYGLSNHLLDTPWPKLARGKARFANAVANADTDADTDTDADADADADADSDADTGDGPLDAEKIFKLLGDQERAPDEALPDTGVGLEAERFLSPAFIAVEGYGTRSSTVLTVDRDGQAELIERQFRPSAGSKPSPQHFAANHYRLSLER